MKRAQTPAAADYAANLRNTEVVPPPPNPEPDPRAGDMDAAMQRALAAKKPK